MTTGRINQVTAALLRKGDPAAVTGSCRRRIPLPARRGTLAKERALTFTRGIDGSRSPPHLLAILTRTSEQRLQPRAPCSRRLHRIASAGYPRRHPRPFHSLQAFPRHGEGRLQTPIYARTGAPAPQRQQPCPMNSACRLPLHRDCRMHPGNPPSAGGETASAEGEFALSLSPLLPTLQANAVHCKTRHNTTRTPVSPTPGG